MRDPQVTDERLKDVASSYHGTIKLMALELIQRREEEDKDNVSTRQN